MRSALCLIKCILLFMFLTLFVQVPTAWSGVGVAPAELELRNVLRGTTIERTMTVYNTFGYEVRFNIFAVGDAKKWIKLYNPEHPTTPIKSLKIPAKESSAVRVKFKVPKDAANGMYKSKIYVQKGAAKPESEDSSMGATLKMPCLISILVTGDQILQGEVSSISAQDIEIGYPLKIMVAFINRGNVTAKPQIDVSITQAGIDVDHFTYVKTRVPLEQNKTIPVKWSTKGRSVGDYLAKVKVSLDGTELTSQNLPFKVLPFGTLSRKGYLSQISFRGEPGAGKTIKILAQFRNNGKIDTDAKFIGEVYKSGDLVDKIESEKSLVPVSTTTTLESYFKIPESGAYEIKGHVAFEGKKSNKKELRFNVGYPLWMKIIFATGLMLVIYIGIWLISRRKAKHESRHC